ncbi:hypothetical protein H7Q97_04830 [Ochrobactrum sp. CM-21-5]|nr:hypothetical protein [Ochrobactrum sp. CM-21-5]
MGKILRLVLLGLVGAAIVHIAVLFLVPVYSDKNAWSRIESASDAYRFHRIDPQHGPVSDNDPLVKQATCRFDLADGPVHITTKGDVPFWSLSVYAPNGDNLYSLNDSVSNERQLDLIVADPIGMASLRAGGLQSDGQSILIEQNIGEGAVVLRVFVPDATWQTQVKHFFDAAQCQPYEGM